MDKARLLARTLLNLPENRQVEITKDLAMLEAACSGKLIKVLGNPLLDEEKTEAIARKIFEGKVCKEMVQFAGFLARKKEFANIARIRRVYRQMLERKAAALEVEVTTASPLSPEAQEILKTAISNKLAKPFSMKEKVDPSVLGGVAIRIGDKLYDNTLKKRVDNLHRQLTH